MNRQPTDQPPDDDDDPLFPDGVPDRPPSRPIKTFDDMTDAEREAAMKRWSKPRRTRGKARTPENSVRDKIERWLTDRKILFRRINAGFTEIDNGDGTSRIIQHAPPGTSDYLALISVDVYGVRVGVFAAIETKAPGKKPTDLQEKFLQSVEKRGGIRIVCTNTLELQTAIEQYAQTLRERLRENINKG